jgi:hypothetical protein
MEKKGITAGKFGWGALILTVLLAACSDQLLSAPELRAAIESGGGQNSWGTPQGLSASLGKTRTISLSWETVEGAVRYNIYKSPSPLVEFALGGQTTGAVSRYELLVQPGESWYFQVEAVDYRGRVTPRSLYAFGASLARPEITAVAAEGGITTVHWYMTNAAAYQENVRYRVSCYTGDLVEFTSITVDGSVSADTAAVFGGLAQSTAYSFKVMAYLAGAESLAEYSEIRDQTTAPVTNPEAPWDPAAQAGGSTGSITLYFTLPEIVHLPDSGLNFTPHPLYFEIRRKTAGSAGPYQIVCSYYGSDPVRVSVGDVSAALFTYLDSSNSGYTPGARVSWTDSGMLDINRGKKYSYEIQSYVDGVDRKISSTAAVVEITGWTMKKPVLGFEAEGPEYMGTGAEWEAARLPISFEHDNMGIDYSYTLEEHISPLGDGQDGGFAGTVNAMHNLSAADIDAYEADIGLTLPSSPAHRGRGFYSYSVRVFLNETLVETIYTLGSRRVTENKTSVEVKNFTVEDGYPDKFVITWKGRKDQKYVLEYADPAAANIWTKIDEKTAGASSDEGDFSFTHSPASGSVIFRIQAFRGTMSGDYYYSPEAKTLGVPVLSAGPLAYGTINLAWEPVQMADTYRIIYTYDDKPGESYPVVTVPSPGDLEFDSQGRYVYGFRPGEANLANRAGKPLTIKLEALNEARRIAAGGGAEIKTVSAAITGRVFGPAEMARPAASRDISPDVIQLSWNGLSNAAGYYIVRRQLTMDGSGPRTGDEVFYYVNASTLALRIKNLNNGGSDSADVSAQISRTDNTYTLTDKYMGDAAYAVRKISHGFYAEEQNDIVWGYPYSYHVIPVLSENDNPRFNSSANTCALGDVTYINNTIDMVKDTGRLYGFGENVRATKGSANTEINGETVNDRIEVLWNVPARFNDGNTRFFVYRKPEASEGGWTLLTPSAIPTASYTDGLSGGLVPPQAGIAYEYCVGLTRTTVSSGASRPDQNARYLESCQGLVDADFPSETAMTGYILGNAVLVSASRNIQGSDAAGYYETLSWSSAGIDNSAAARKNRGITGYLIQVKNSNVNGGAWTNFKTLAAGADNVDMTENLDNSGGLLKVLRDYRHYFRVRTYYDDNGVFIYSLPPPDPAYAAGGENSWVKWGARQITKKEFAAVTSIAIGSALGGITQGGYDPDGCNTIRTLSPVTLVFPNIDGALYAASSRKGILFFYSPDVLERYGAQAETSLAGLSFTIKAKSFTLTFTGALPMYSGTVYINNLGSSGSGEYTMSFNGFTDFTETAQYFLKPFTFGAEEFKNCNSLDWNENVGWL